MITDFSAGTPTSQVERDIVESAGRISEIEVSLSIPVVLDGEDTAYLSLDNFESSTAFGDEAIEMAKIFAGYVATLAQRFRLERQLHRLAFEDVLTELPNRAALDDRIAATLERANRRAASAALLFLDLDGFKSVNDTLGHSAGDEVLHVVGQRLLGCVRSGDVVGRLGGDEFAVVLEGEDAEPQARVIAQRVLEALSKPIGTGAGVVHMTASVGVAVYPEDGESAEELLNSADAAMYQAKEHGKNTYSFYRND